LPRLDPKVVSKVERMVRRRFPELAGARPKVAAKGTRKGKGAREVYVLTFQKSLPLPNGRRLTRVVRVTVERSGRVLKIVSSR